MDYRKLSQCKRTGARYFVRLDKGEEITESLLAFCRKEKIFLAGIRAIGAADEVETGVFYPAEKVYRSNRFVGDFEILSLLGTVTEKDGEPYLHLHISCGDGEGKAFGGHLTKAVVSVTCEAVVETFPGKVGRKKDESLGINLFDFEEEPVGKQRRRK